MNKIKNIIYLFLDIISFNNGFNCKVNGFNIYFPAKWFRYFENDYEKDNISFLKEKCKPNMTVIDIGAHIGLMSIISAQLVGENGKVYSFEPTPITFEILKNVIKLNRFENRIKAINKAVAKENTTFDFYLSSDEGSNSNSLVSKNLRDRIPIKINIISLDLFVSENKITKVDLIKIDAEGSELDVLLGAEKTISEFKPIIILAIHPPLIKNNNHNILHIYDFLISKSYQIIFENKLMSEEEFCNKENFFDVHLTTI